MRPLDRIRILGALLLVVTGMVGFLQAGVAQADPVSVTHPGTGRFSALKVTVSQTTNLIDQTVHVTWSGGAPTVGNNPRFGADYLQLMECWGDPATGPTPQQCEFGASGDTRGGQTPTFSRQIDNNIHDTGGGLTWPLDAAKYPGGYMPFQAVDGTTVEGNSTGGAPGFPTGFNPYFSQASTNEIPFGMTAADGTGEAYFETVTAREAPGLGCGTKTVSATGVATGRPCFLVVVPRDNHEVDGSVKSGNSLDTLTTSPLSPTNWADRIVFTLDYQPLGDVCPIGAQQRLTVGDEQVAAAALSWQAELCLTGTKTLYGYTSATDDIGRQGLQDADSSDPQLNYVSQPLAAAKYPQAGAPVYAPVALSGLAIAFNIESQSAAGSPTDGKRITTMNLTPRLVAKLLTESYKWGTIGSDPIDLTGAMKNNPTNMAADPDFLAVNPQFKDLSLTNGLPDALVPQFTWDSANLLWQWVLSDKKAADFLAGTPDPNGMVVNPNYLHVAWPVNIYPKLQNYSQPIAGQLPIGIFDYRPYANNMSAAARAALRGDPLQKNSWDPNANPPGFTASPPQAAGLRSIIAVTTTAEAAQFGLPVAFLQNAAGKFVQPDGTGLTASANSMKNVGGLLQPDPASTDPAAYPLTTLTYASTVPAAINKQEAADYAALINYSVGAGQVQGIQPGQLPAGYAPLPAALVTTAQSVATQIVTLAGMTGGPGTGTPSGSASGTATGSPTGSPTSGPSGSGSATSSSSGVVVGVDIPSHTTPRATATSRAGSGSGGSGGGSGGSGGNGGGVIPPKGTITAPARVAVTGGVITPTPTRAAKVQPLLVGSIPVGFIRYLLLIVLIAGGGALASGPLLRWHVLRHGGRQQPDGATP